MSSPSDPTTPSAEADTPRVSLTQLRGRMKSASKMKRDLAMRRRLYGVSPDHQSVRVSKTPGVADPEERHFLVISMNNTYRKGWDFAQAFILLYVGFVVPFRVGLDEPAMGGWFIVDLLVDLYFWIDILLNFFTSYYDEDRGEEVFELAAISARYTRGWFWIDVAAGLPLDSVERMQNGTFWCSFNAGGCTKEGDGDGGFQIFKFIKLARMLKLLRLFRIKRLLEKYEHHFVHYLPWVDFASLIGLLLFLGHVFGCFFYFFSTKDWWSDSEKERLGEEDTWIYSQFGVNPEDHGVWTRYIAAMYWAFTTMTTVGYGDISATTVAERLFAIIGMIAGGFVFSLLIGSVAGVMSASKRREVAMQTKLSLVTSFLRDNKVPHALSSKVYQFARLSGVGSQLESERVIRGLPYGLRRELMSLLYRDLVASNPLFVKMNDVLFTTECCSRMTMMFWPMHDVIYRRGEIASGVYFVVKGLANIVKAGEEEKFTFKTGGLPNEMVERIMLPGSYFGEGSVLGFKRRNRTVTSRTACRFAVIAKEDFADLIDMYPRAYKILAKNYLLRVKAQKINLKLDADDEDAKDPADPADVTLLAELRRSDTSSTNTNEDADTLDAKLDRLSGEREAVVSTRAIQNADKDESEHEKSVTLEEDDDAVFSEEAVELNDARVRRVGETGPRGLAAFRPTRTNSALRRQLQATESVDGSSSSDGEDGDLAFDTRRAEAVRARRDAKRL